MAKPNPADRLLKVVQQLPPLASLMPGYVPTLPHAPLPPVQVALSRQQRRALQRKANRKK